MLLNVLAFALRNPFISFSLYWFAFLPCSAHIQLWISSWRPLSSLRIIPPSWILTECRANSNFLFRVVPPQEIPIIPIILQLHIPCVWWSWSRRWQPFSSLPTSSPSCTVPTIGNASKTSWTSSWSSLGTRHLDDATCAKWRSKEEEKAFEETSQLLAFGMLKTICNFKIFQPKY